MGKEIGENTKITLDLKTIGIVLFFVATVIGMWFTLQADIEVAKDELIRTTIMDTQDDVEDIKSQLEKIDERLYELQKRK